MDTNFIKSDSAFRALDGVNTLLMSETRVMETVLQSKYQCMKTGDVGFLLEGISDMSEIIKESSNDFVQEIGDFQKNVNSQMTELIKRHDKITAYHILDKVDHVNFTFAGYNFKTLSTKRINLFELDNMVSDYNNLLDRLVSSVDDLDELDNIETELQYYLEEMYLSKIRARTLGVSRSIYTDDFIDYVKEYYRGSVTPVNISVDKDYIKSIQKEKDNLIKDRDATIKEFACALRTFENFSRYLTMTLNDLTKSDSDHTIALSMSRNTVKGTLSARLCTIHVTDPQSLYKITTILRLVYSRMVKLQSIVHVILSERLNALKDQASQDIQVLNNLKTYAVNKVEENEDPVYSALENLRYLTGDNVQFFAQPVLDYTSYALEQFITNHLEDMAKLEKRYVQETMFVQRCLENLCVDNIYAIMEASESSIKDRLIEFLNKIIAIFRKKMIEYNNKYKTNISNLYKQGVFEQKAKAFTEDIEILPYWKVTNIEQDRNLIRTALTKGASNKDLDNLSYMSSMVSVSNVSEWDDKKGQLRGYLLNYFRCHEKDAEQVKKIKVSGPEISSNLRTIVDYILGYDKIVTGLENLRREAETQISSLTKVQESFRFLEIEQRFIENTDIALLEGFSALLEADTNEQKTGETVGTDGEKTSPTSVETTDSGKSNTSSNTGDTKDENKPTSNRYANIYERFFELAITAYMTACEERYISYINILRAINGGAFSSDKDKKEKTSDGKEKVTDSTLFTESYFNKPSELKGTSLYK